MVVDVRLGLQRVPLTQKPQAQEHNFKRLTQRSWMADPLTTWLRLHRETAVCVPAFLSATPFGEIVNRNGLISVV
jgi:hypothetical protein